MIPKTLLEIFEILGASFVIVFIGVHLLPKNTGSNIVQLKPREHHQSPKRVRKAS